MEETNKKLYPIEFLEDAKEMPWGHVSYQVADLGAIDSMVAGGWFGGNTLSELMGTYLERVVGDEAFEYYGLQFPLMLKVIRTTLRQPLQVNVGDEAAEERYDSFGKTAFWYIKEAADDAALFLGLNRDVDAGEFYRRCQDGTMDEILNLVHPKAGDCFVIRPGTVFAAGPGLTIVEISECSELTFDLTADLEEVFDLIDFRHSFPTEADATGSQKLAEEPEFTVTKFDLENPLHIFSDQPGSFAIYHCTSGEAFVQAPAESGGYENWTLKTGKSILVPSEVNDFMLFPAADKTVLLEATVERRSLPDSYTGGGPAGDNPDPHVRQWN